MDVDRLRQDAAQVGDAELVVHRLVRLDDLLDVGLVRRGPAWLLEVVPRDADRAVASRGRGPGRLLATVAQEGMLRLPQYS